MTRVSFVVPTRNQASFLTRCLDSCLAQELVTRPSPPFLQERAGRVVYLPETLACATCHPAGKSIRGMRRQIREFVVLKARHGRRLGLPAFAWARVAAGVLALHAYWAATTLGLRRAA